MELIDHCDATAPLLFRDFLERHAATIPARRCHYIALFPNEASDRRIRAGLGAIRASGGVEAADMVALDASNENSRVLSDDTLAAMDAFVRESGLPQNRLILVAQGSGPPVEDEVRRAGINWVPFHHWPARLARTYADVPLTDFGYEALADLPAKFLSLNRMVRPHRHLLLEHIRRTALADIVLKSERQGEAAISPRRMAEIVERWFPLLRHLAPDPDQDGWPEARSDFPPGRRANFDRVGAMPLSFPEEATRRTILSLVTETDFRRPVIRLTEKSFKPLVAHRPFVIAGPPRGLSLLRDFGFATFPDAIDETYDSVIDPQDRLVYILAELERLRARLATPMARRDFIAATRETCAHNQRHLARGFLDTLDRQTLRALAFALERPAFGPLVASGHH